MLLLHLFYCLFPHRIRIIYVDHQLQDVSAEWGRMIQAHCIERGISCVVAPVQVKQGNLESEARQARYEAFSQHIQNDEVLVLAHHEQDQAETLLLRLLSGAGVSGLAAMKEIDMHQGVVRWRPLLSCSRQQIATWVKQWNIFFVDDPTNLDTHYDRAWARSTLWPVLLERFPQMQSSVARTAGLMQDAEEILADVVANDLKRCMTQNILDLTVFKQLSLPRQRQLLSIWLKADNVYRPNYAQVERIQKEVIDSRKDAQAALFCKPFWYVRFQGKVYQLKNEIYLAKQYDLTTSEQLIQFDISSQVELLSGEFDVGYVKNMGLSNQLLSQPLKLVQRVGGEKIHLFGRIGHWPLKKAIQQAEIFPWLRHRVQILQSDDVILGVFTPNGFWLAQSTFCQKGGWLPKLVCNSALVSGEEYE